jgi:hypothetical protein
MKSWLRLIAGLAALAALAKDSFAADATHPTVVELFRSQGCSDCPPAVANVAAISDRADVLALVFSVDYWDRLGWKDTFSKPEWTARQYAYAHAIGRDGVYTPQVIVNGRVEGTGLDANELAGLMRNAERGDGGPSVDFTAGAVAVGAAAWPGGGADVWLVRYDSRVIDVVIKRGENAGKTLPHKNVVREMILLGHWRGEAASFPCPLAGTRSLRRRRSCRLRVRGRCSRRRGNNDAATRRPRRFSIGEAARPGVFSPRPTVDIIKFRVRKSLLPVSASPMVIGIGVD